MQGIRAFITCAAIVLSATSGPAMSQGSGQASAPRPAEPSGSASRGATAHRLVVVPAEISMSAGFANGCWVRLYDGRNFEGEELMLVGPLQLARMGTTSPWWRRWNSLIVGPRARMTLYSEPHYQGLQAALDARQRSSDLGGKALGWSRKIESAQVDCSAN